MAAFGHLLQGEKDKAIAAAHEAMRLMPYPDKAVRTVIASDAIAGILARAGAVDEAIEIIESATASTPGLPPNITISIQDKNPRAGTLKAKLEAEMSANAKLLGVASTGP